MAASDRGLQSVPRGLDRNLTTYLQAIRTELLRLSGLVRGSDQSRAVRASEASAAFGGGSVSTPSGSVDVAAIASQIFRDGSVTERKLADRAVTGGKLADNAVTARTIAPGEVDNNALAEQAVTAGKLAGGTVTAGALANGCVTRGKLAEDAVDTRNLMDGAVTSDKIEEGAVTTERLGDWAVTFYKISPGAVGTESIRDGSVTAKKLAKVRAASRMGLRRREGWGNRRHSGELGWAARSVSDGMELHRSRGGPRNGGAADNRRSGAVHRGSGR